MSDVLLPCPFCGAAAERRTDGMPYDAYENEPSTEVYFVECTSCPARVGPCDTRPEAQARWNMRADDATAGDKKE